MQAQVEQVGTKRDLGAEQHAECPTKCVHYTASKINGIAPKRKPRIGADFQAVIPPLPAKPEQHEQP